MLPRLLPSPTKASLVLWYGNDGDRRGIVYETTSFELELEYDTQVGPRFVAKLDHPVMVDEKAFVREEER